MPLPPSRSTIGRQAPARDWPDETAVAPQPVHSQPRPPRGVVQVSHADRYVRGEEFMAVVKALWDSWAADAVIDDRAAGVYARRDRITPIKHRGDFYQVAGPLNLPRCPQGRPVLVQAGSSDTGREFAACHAEAIFTAQVEKTSAQAFYADLKARVAGVGRGPEQVLILPGPSPLITSS